jgi:hypothetical protein
MTLASSAYIDSYTKFIPRGKTFIYILNSTGPRPDPWGIPRFNVPHSEKKNYVKLSDVTSAFCLL